MIDNSNIFMGIDVSKETLDISVQGKHFHISNTKPALTAFLKKHTSVTFTLCALESTGGYEKLAIKLLQDFSIPIHKAHPNRVHAFAKACNHFAKTDKLDSFLLEKYAAFAFHELKNERILFSEQQQNLQELRALQCCLNNQLHANRCRLEHASKESKKYLESIIMIISQQLKDLEKAIQNLIKNDPSFSAKQKLLITFKGVGEKTSSMLLAHLPELGTISNKKIANLTGLAPQTNISGKKTSKARIHGGRFHVRKSLYMAAMVAIRYNEEMKIVFKRLVDAGKPFKVAIVAIMRKIIVCLNAMLKDNTPYGGYFCEQ